jgi:hypothetical protein
MRCRGGAHFDYERQHDVVCASSHEHLPDSATQKSGRVSSASSPSRLSGRQQLLRVRLLSVVHNLGRRTVFHNLAVL